METKNKSIKKYDADTMVCIQSAYEDLQLMIKEIFTNIKSIPDQLSFEQFITLFEKYDWQDIIYMIEEYNYLEAQQDYPSLYDLLFETLKADEGVYCIDGFRNNSYYREYFRRV